MSVSQAVAGTSGNDTIIVGAGNNTIFGGAIDFDIVASSGDFNGGTNEIIRIDGQTGDILESFNTLSAPAIPDTDGLTFLNDPRDVFLDGLFGALNTTVLINTGFVPAADGNDLTLNFTQSGEFINVFADLGDSGFFVNPGGGVFGPNGNVFVGSRTEGTVFEFDGETGEAILSEGGGFFDPSEIDFPRGFVFGPDGTLFIGNGSNPSTGEGEDNIFAVDPVTRELTVFAAPDEFSPLDVILSPDGTQLVVSSEFPFTGGSLDAANPGAVFIFDIETGETLQILDPGLDENGDPILLAPRGLGFAPDGTLFVSSTGNGRLLQFNPDTGEFLGIFAELFETDADGNVTANLNGQGFTFVLPDDFDAAADGNDTVSFEDISFGVTANLFTGLSTFEDTGAEVTTNVLIGIENLSGTAAADNLLGNNVANTLTGADGNDLLSGFGGSDSIEGGEGDDLLFASVGDDTLLGGAGNDQIFGNLGVDSVNGGAGNDLLFGGDGADTVIGDAGDDTIFAGAGDDAFISGGSGNDIIRAGDGNDGFIDGGTGNDTLFGGAGNDTFFFNQATGDDVISDFVIGEDLINVDAFNFSDFGALENAAEQVGDNVVIQLDTDDTLTILNVQLSDLGASDFVFG